MSQSEPAKWIKYQKLVEFGFISQAQLRKDVRRFSCRDCDSLVQELTEEIAAAERRGVKILGVVKLVGTYQKGQLPNYRVECAGDLEGLKKFLVPARQRRVPEVWCCISSLSEGLCAGGRIGFFSSSRYGHVLEMIWGASPRLIETISSQSAYIYARTRRVGWGWSYKIDVLHRPQNCSHSEIALRSDLITVLKLVEGARDRIEAFVCWLEERGGFTSLSLEFKVENFALKIIDWDTPDDNKILFG